jgi:hypothetical protein
MAARRVANALGCGRCGTKEYCSCKLRAVTRLYSDWMLVANQSDPLGWFVVKTTK